MFNAKKAFRELHGRSYGARELDAALRAMILKYRRDLPPEWRVEQLAHAARKEGWIIPDEVDPRRRVRVIVPEDSASTQSVRPAL